MHPILTTALYTARVQDFHDTAARQRRGAASHGGRRWSRRAAPAAAVPAPVTIRWAEGRRDEPALERLAALDSSTPLQGSVLVAEVDGELWAALAPDSYHEIADPFRPSADLLRLLNLRSRQLQRAARERPARRPVAGGSAALGAR